VVGRHVFCRGTINHLRCPPSRPATWQASRRAGPACPACVAHPTHPTAVVFEVSMFDWRAGLILPIDPPQIMEMLVDPADSEPKGPVVEALLRWGAQGAQLSRQQRQGSPGSAAPAECGPPIAGSGVQGCCCGRGEPRARQPGSRAGRKQLVPCKGWGHRSGGPLARPPPHTHRPTPPHPRTHALPLPAASGCATPTSWRPLTLRSGRWRRARWGPTGDGG
jgi:hypothetical protein